MMAGLITNGYFLVPKRIEELNARRPRLPADQHRQRRAGRGVEEEPARARQEAAAPAATTPTFDVNINSVLGGGIKNPEDARTINTRARELGLLDLDRHHPRRLGPAEAARPGRAQGVRRGVGRRSAGRGRCSRTCIRGSRNFQDNLADGKPNEWRCRAGARYLYVCEDGLVHYCSQQRGYPGRAARVATPIDDIRREFVDAEVVRAVLHGRLRPPRLDDGLLAIAASKRPLRPDGRDAVLGQLISRPCASDSKVTAGARFWRRRPRSSGIPSASRPASW